MDGLRNRVIFMLPPALLDLLSHRLAASRNVSILPIQAIGHIRHVQQLATQYQSPILNSHEIPMPKASRGARYVSPRLSLCPWNKYTFPDSPKKSVIRDGYSKRKRQAQTQVQALAELETRVAALKDATAMSMTVG